MKRGLLYPRQVNFPQPLVFFISMSAARVLPINPH